MIDRQRTSRANGVRPQRVSHPYGRARGSERSTMPFTRRIMITFDDETFEEIADRAHARQRPFAAEVRELVELGLETAKEHRL